MHGPLRPTVSVGGAVAGALGCGGVGRLAAVEPQVGTVVGQYEWCVCTCRLSLTSRLNFGDSSTSSIYSPNYLEMTTESDAVASIVLEEFRKLPTKRKPCVRDNGLHEWVPLSGIVAKGTTPPFQ